MALTWVSILFACGASGPPPTPEAPLSQPEPAPQPAAEHPIDADLLTWMAAQGSQSLQVPIVLSEGPIGGFDAIIRHEAVEIPVRLDSTALSMTLDMHVGRHCESYPCAVSMVCTWGPLIGTPDGGAPTLTVRKVLGPTPPDEAGQVRLSK